MKRSAIDAEVQQRLAELLETDDELEQARTEQDASEEGEV